MAGASFNFFFRNARREVLRRDTFDASLLRNDCPPAQGSLAFVFASDAAYWPGVLLRGQVDSLSDALQRAPEGISDISDISHVVLSQASSLAENLLHTLALAKANKSGQRQRSFVELKGFSTSFEMHTSKRRQNWRRLLFSSEKIGRKFRG